MQYAAILERYSGRFASVNEIRWAIEEALERHGYGHPYGTTNLPNDPEFAKSLKSTLDEWAGRRSAGEPFQYIIGHWPFAGLDLICDSRALIPRPETEGLVELVISDLRNGDKRDVRVLDLGCGTGAIGLSLAASGLVSHVTLVDFSEGACELTRENRERNGTSIHCEVEVVQSNWFDGLAGSEYDLIVSNPPYIKTSDIVNLQVELTMEPVSALDGGRDGIEPYRLILREAMKYLSGEGIIYFEIGFDQGNDLVRLSKDFGFSHVEIVKDLALLDRYVVASA
ncbi:MAG: peptide chain release factor N(5)-glutamine methyltransferase [Actinomycetota bacterium]|nr:peptide chain release factor N(5)-glutamine methyltransferase [Actinomycetota bacterium]